MASITTWMRLEPHSRGANMEAGLEMRVHDPLWMLARQWQFGEFQGEDTGSPVWVALSGDQMPLELYLPGPLGEHDYEQVQLYSPDIPLEYLIEKEQTPALEAMGANRRLAVEAGQHFLWLLGEPLASAHSTHLIATFGLTPLAKEERPRLDPDSLAFLDLMAGRALDGARLLAAIQKTSSPETGAIELGFSSSDVPRVAPVITSWLDWCEWMVGPVAVKEVAVPAWNPKRMEYSCALAAPANSAGDQVVLAAVEYTGGRLDWYSFDMMTKARLNRDISATSVPFHFAAPPTALGFRGLPSNRLWEFEDGQVRFGSIQAGPTDLARMLLVEYLLEYGNDFFAIPIELTTGSLFRIDKLTITNTFGDLTTPLPLTDQAWQMFALSTEGAASGAISSPLFLPPVLGQHLASPPLEELHLLRDEMANIAWAVEHIVESEAGQPLNRHESYQARRQRDEQHAKPPVGNGTLVYRLDTWESTLPDYWIPLVPELSAPGQSPMLLACYDPHGHSRGRLLSEHPPGTWLYLFDEEVPRAGAHVTRTQQYTRWYDGLTFVWIGREKRPGRGESSSGLQHDITEMVENS